MSLAIIADSCCDTTPEIREKLGVILVPLTIESGPNSFIDDLSLDTDKLLASMDESKEATHSACPSVETYAEHMRNSDESIVVTLSSKLSGSYNSARLACELVKEETPQKKIAVFDSKSAASAELLIALFVDKLRSLGESFEAVVAKTDEYINSLHTLFVLENLSNMVKNGRMSKVKGIVASVLSIHPVLADDGSGEIRILHTVRGLNHSLDKLVSCVCEFAETHPANSRVLAISHCNCAERAEQIRDDIMAHSRAFSEAIIVPARGISTVYESAGGVVIAF
ncbi:MAG: DegV family protein [Oscillospiraceae bacterium]